MSGQTTVTIKGKQWSVAVATTPSELTSGLSGVESLPQQTGMLFDLGYDQNYIAINMSQMLFPLDIIFINSTRGVVGVLHDVPPQEAAAFQNDTLPGARLFLEINAGEAQDVAIGDSVDIQGHATQAAQIDIGNLINLAVIVGMMMAMTRILEAPKKPSLPPGYVPVKGAKPSLPPVKIAGPRKAPPPITEATREEELRQKKVTLEAKGREIAKEAGVEFTKLEEGWQPRYATPRYWFKEPGGKTMIARDLEELKWKLSFVRPELSAQTKRPTGRFTIHQDRMGNIIITRTDEPQKSVFLQFESDKDLVYDLLRKPEREELDNGWTVEVKDTEPRASILQELWEHAATPLSLSQTEQKPPAGYAEWKVKLEAGYGEHRPGVSEAQVEREAKSIPKDILCWYFREKIGGQLGYLPLTSQEIAQFRKRTGHMPTGVMPKLPPESRGDLLFFEYIHDLVKLGGVISDEEAKAMWQASRSESVADIIPLKKPRPGKQGKLEYLADSPEFLTQTIEAIGYRDKLDTTFQQAIARAKGLR